MITSSRDIADGAHLHADLLVVGSGAAGITIARHFEGRSKRVIVLESGGETYDEKVQSLYRGTLTGTRADPPLEASRLRYFGGTTNHWSGWCRPLEPADFERRADWPESGWPITRADLEPYYGKAAPICRLGTVSFDDIAFWRRQPGGKKINPLPLNDKRFRSAIFQISNSLLFGELYGPELRAARDVNVVLNATVLELLPASGHHADQVRKRIDGVRVRTMDGGTATVSARATVVAAGGIESARLLLLSDKVHPHGAGNEHDLVGRYFIDHVWLNANCFLHFVHAGLDLPVYFDQLRIGDAQMFEVITGTRQLLEQEQIGAFRIWLKPSNASTAGIESAHDFAGAISHGRLPKNFFADLGNMLADLDVLSDAAYKSLFHTNKSLFSHAQSATNVGAWLDINFEQRPDRDNRVQLGDDRDGLGQRRVKVNWRLGETERRTAVRALEVAAAEFGRMGIGRSRINFDFSSGQSWPSNMVSSCHHSGTARMSESPATGVVDSDCRVHSTDNLYVAGSAVFPTIGYANPTLTIVALAQRLAEHLEGILA